MRRFFYCAGYQPQKAEPAVWICQLLKGGEENYLTYALEQGSNAYLKPLGNEIQSGERHIRFSAFNLAHVAAVNAALVRK